MISDVLFEAKEEIERYLNDPVYNYKPIEGELLALIEKMEEMRKKLDAVPTFNDMWKPTQVFLALRTSCKHVYIEGEQFYFCTHPQNQTVAFYDKEHCNHENCPLLAQFEK